MRDRTIPERLNEAIFLALDEHGEATVGTVERFIVNYSDPKLAGRAGQQLRYLKAKGRVSCDPVTARFRRTPGT